MASISEQPPRRSTFLSSGARSIAGFQALFLNRNAIVTSLKIFGLSVGMAVAISPASAQPATYHDVEAMDAAVLRFDGVAGGRMQVRDIGTTANGRPVRAVHIAATPNLYGTEAEASMADKPALLIECGMHAREWAGPELCLKYLQVFALGFLLDPVRINDILANADIYVIPMVNPDGRAWDDTEGGDPNKYWTSTVYGPERRRRLAPQRAGVACDNASGTAVGIDVARSFSTGWSDAAIVVQERTISAATHPSRRARRRSCGASSTTG